MAICKSYLDFVQLYRGQVRDYGVIVSSGWRQHWKARQVARNALHSLVADYVTGSARQEELRDRLVQLASKCEDAPTFYKYLAEPECYSAVVQLADHFRKSVSRRWATELTSAELGELESVFFFQHQAYLFGTLESDFLHRYLPWTLRELIDLTFKYYKIPYNEFCIETRIRQVVTDLQGISQHYGALGTPGIDLTDTLAIALWFATREVVIGSDGSVGYRELPPSRWGYVFVAKVPTVVFSTISLPLTEIGTLPDCYAVNLANLSPLLLRIKRQHGWYGATSRGWFGVPDYAKLFQMKRHRVAEYGTVEHIRGLTEHLSADFLFPGPSEDSFRAFLADNGVPTFL